jgi:hypothetical protein
MIRVFVSYLLHLLFFDESKINITINHNTYYYVNEEKCFDATLSYFAIINNFLESVFYYISFQTLFKAYNWKFLALVSMGVGFESTTFP